MLEITRDDLRLLELIYDAVVVFDDRRQVLMCRHCRGERTLHRDDCYFGDLARLIDTLQRYAPDERSADDG
jgi:hypothetical protein